MLLIRLELFWDTVHSRDVRVRATELFATDNACCACVCVCIYAQILKPVNQRAQGRVPPPEDLDLEQAIDGAALDRLMAVEVHSIALLVQIVGTPRSPSVACDT